MVGRLVQEKHVGLPVDQLAQAHQMCIRDRFLTAPGAKNPKETEQISDAKTITYDTAWAGSHKEEFQTKWADMTGR